MPESDRPDATHNPDGSMTVHIHSDDKYVPSPLPAATCGNCARELPARENPRDLGPYYPTIEKKKLHGEQIDRKQQAYLAGDWNLEQLSMNVGFKATRDFVAAAKAPGRLKYWIWAALNLTDATE